MSFYQYRVFNIEWGNTGKELPRETEVMLSSWLVCSDEDLSDQEWEEAVNDELQTQFGSRAQKFSFQPSTASGGTSDDAPAAAQPPSNEEIDYVEGYEFLVTRIEWDADDGGLPDEATVRLPDWLVHADEIDDQQWEDEICQRLEQQFGKRAKPNFGFELID